MVVRTSMQLADLCCFIFDNSLVDVLECLGQMQLEQLLFRFQPVCKDAEIPLYGCVKRCLSSKQAANRRVDEKYLLLRLVSI
jgi:hypothetical protein